MDVLARVIKRDTETRTGTVSKLPRKGSGFSKSISAPHRCTADFWKTALAGKVTYDRKILYGQAFAIYALTEYHCACCEPEPLRTAIELYRLIQQHAHDDAHGGRLEHFERDWQPILDPSVHVEVEIAGCKSANTHLHSMEAFAELAEVAQDVDVVRSLAESVRINQQYFDPPDPNAATELRALDCQPVGADARAELSYGHNVEFAWSHDPR